MLTGMEVQRESGQSKDENSEVVRLKKKINALIELLEKHREKSNTSILLWIAIYRIMRRWNLGLRK